MMRFYGYTWVLKYRERRQLFLQIGYKFEQKGEMSAVDMKCS